MRRLAGPRGRVKLSHDELMRRLRLGDVRKLVRDRCGPILPDDDAGREYLKELLLPISLWPYEARKGRGRIEIWGPTEKMRCEIERWAPWMSDDEAQEILDDINLTPEWQRRPAARTLGKRLNLTYAERARLLLRTIGPCDMTEKVMALMRKQKKRRQDKLRRQKQPRTEYLAASLSQTQPWLELGVSRRTYYRRIKQEQARGTGVHHIKLIQTDGTLVPKEKTHANAAECGRLSTPTPAGQTDASADGFLTADEAAWLVDAVSLRHANALAA
jgi:hypothetical protein